MISARGIIVPDTYVTQGTWARIMPVRKLTFISDRDILVQFINHSWQTFQPPGIDEITIPAGYVSKPFGEDIFGFRFRCKGVGTATVEFYSD